MFGFLSLLPAGCGALGLRNSCLALCVLPSCPLSLGRLEVGWFILRVSSAESLTTFQHSLLPCSPLIFLFPLKYSEQHSFVLACGLRIPFRLIKEARIQSSR